MIDQLKKQIKELRKSNSDLEQQLKTTENNQKKIDTEDLTSNLENEAFKERLITILESTSDYVSISTPDFKITYINKAGMQMIGIKDGVLPRDLKIIEVHPKWALNIIQKEGIPKAISEGIWRGETALLKMDGSVIPISQVIMSHKSYTGEVGFLSTIIRDISELKEIEEKLVESENKFRELLENTQNIFYKLNLKTLSYDYISPSIERVLGYTIQEFSTTNVSKAVVSIHPEDYKKAIEYRNEIMNSKPDDPKFYSWDMRFKHKNGEYRWFKEQSKLIRDYNGNPLYIVASMTDITEIKNAKRELEYYLEFEKIVSKISAELINIPINEIDSAIENALQTLVQFTNTTRGNVYKFSDDLSEFSCTHEWCIDQKYTQQALFQKMPSKQFPYITKMLKKLKPLILSEPAEIHGNATGAKMWQKKYGYRPAIMIPMIFKNKLYGMLEINGKDDEKRYWSETFITLLNFLAGIFVSALERKKTEAKLRESEGKFRLISEQSLLGILIIQDDIVKYVNDAVTNILDYTKEQMITGLPLNYSTIFHPEDWEFQRDQSRLKQHDGEGAIANYKLRVLPVTVTGKVKWIEIYSHTIMYLGKPAELVMMIDITEKIRVEVALKESEEKFRMLSEQSLMAVLIIQDNVARYANEAYSKILEYPIDEILAWEANQIFQTIHPEDRKSVIEQARKKQIGLENGIITHYTYRIITRSGKVKWVENYSKTIQYGDKLADFVTLIDISETVIAERAKQESENRYQNLVETMNEGLAIIDINNKLTYVNPKLIQMTGYSRKELIDRTIFDFFGEEDIMIISDHFSKHKKGLSGLFEMEWRKKDGSKLYTMISTQPILDEQGNNSGSSAVVTDITDLKKYEKELESRTESLEKALKEKESLMRELHHRVKNNLQIISAITIMQEETVDEKQKNVFKEYQNRIKSMAKIHEILYRSEDIEYIDMEGYILNLIQNLILSYNVDQERIKIDLKIENLDLNISKAMHYGLIINELISNAIKYAFPGDRKGKLSVTIKKTHEDRIILIVEDNGIGMPSEINYTNPSTMGLKIIKTSTDQLKGEIILEKNKGTKWKIIFHS